MPGRPRSCLSPLRWPSVVSPRSRVIVLRPEHRGRPRRGHRGVDEEVEMSAFPAKILLATDGSEDAAPSPGCAGLGGQGDREGRRGDNPGLPAHRQGGRGDPAPERGDSRRAHSHREPGIRPEVQPDEALPDGEYLREGLALRALLGYGGAQRPLRPALGVEHRPTSAPRRTLPPRRRRVRYPAHRGRLPGAGDGPGPRRPRRAAAQGG